MQEETQRLTGTRTPPPPPDAYRLRELEEERSVALASWALKVKIFSALQLAITALMIYSPYWYVCTIGLITGSIGFYGAWTKKNEFVFVYSLLIAMNMGKSVVLLYLYWNHSSHITGYNAFVVFLGIIDVIVLTPFAAYNSFYFYHSLKADLTFSAPL